MKVNRPSVFSLPPSKIMVIDDDTSLHKPLEAGLTMAGFRVSFFSSPHKALQKFYEEPFDVVLTDLRMPNLDGIELCQKISTNHPDIPVVIFTGFGSVDSASEALRAGASDYVTKPFDLDDLILKLERAARLKKARQAVQQLPDQLETGARTDFGFVFASDSMKKVHKFAKIIADSDFNLLITGETGSGKEVLARSIHRMSPRCNKTFLAINCAAVPPDLLENELFGHVSGAYTDARTASEGIMKSVKNGTLLLDEIGEMPIQIQPKLLRVIEDRTLRPIGSHRQTSFEARLIATTNRNLENEIRSGRFRKDLYFRLNVVNIEIPPLRKRKEDIFLLAQHFINELQPKKTKKLKSISEEAAERLLNYSWPGNVRELKNVIERGSLLARYDHLMVEDLPENLRRTKLEKSPAEEIERSDLIPLEDLEKKHILKVLNAVHGNRAKAARILGIDRKTLYRKLRSTAPLS